MNLTQKAIASMTNGGPPLLANFLHGSSPDPATRTMAAAMLSLTCWQRTGRSATPALPSVLLVNAGAAAVDPLDALANDLATGLDRKDPAKVGTGAFAGGTPEMALTAVVTSVKLREHLGTPGPNNQAQIQALEQRFHAARTTGYGSGIAAYYAGAWNKELGWMTDPCDAAILRLDRPEDHAAFREDVRKHPERLIAPQSPGRHLGTMDKSLAISGSLGPKAWDGVLVHDLIDLGLPLFFLPHLASDPLVRGGDPLAMTLLSVALGNFANGVAGRPAPIVARSQLMGGDWIRHYERVLRSRLRELPGAYEFAVLRAVRELGPVCAMIVEEAAAPGTPTRDLVKICGDLHEMAFRGIVIGVASLAYHGLGFPTGQAPRAILEVLSHLREAGSLSRRDLLRKYPVLKSESRDRLLARLAAEGLIALGPRQITAVPLADFIRALHQRPEFPEPRYLWPEPEKKAKT